MQPMNLLEGKILKSFFFLHAASAVAAFVAATMLFSLLLFLMPKFCASCLRCYRTELIKNYRRRKEKYIIN